MGNLYEKCTLTWHHYVIKYPQSALLYEYFVPVLNGDFLLFVFLTDHRSLFYSGVAVVRTKFVYYVERVHKLLWARGVEKLGQFAFCRILEGLQQGRIQRDRLKYVPHASWKQLGFGVRDQFLELHRSLINKFKIVKF